MTAVPEETRGARLEAHVVERPADGSPVGDRPYGIGLIGVTIFRGPSSGQLTFYAVRGKDRTPRISVTKKSFLETPENKTGKPDGKDVEALCVSITPTSSL